MPSYRTPSPLDSDPSSEIAPETAVLSVSSLNRMARSLLEANFPAVIVEGEISNLAQPASGHWYLTLKDKNAQIRCAMFANRNRLVRFRPANGNQVIVRGRLSIYEGRGDYQLIADSIEEAGDGALRRAFEELKRKLQLEGLFDEAAKQQVLNQYRHIGIITSPTGAAIRDMLTVFARRFPATRITLIPVAVQGKESAPEIVRALARANALREQLGLEALIIGRGGGSLEDLQAFNDESVARAIYASALPVTSAVGHEIDFTIADFVADLRAPTPSAAAELMSPDQADYLATLAAFRSQLVTSLQTRLRHDAQQLSALARHLKRPDRRLQEQAQNLDRMEASLKRAMVLRLQQRKASVLQFRRDLLTHSPRQKMRAQKLLLTNTLKRLRQAVGHRLQRSQASLAGFSRSLQAVSPLQTLARGFSISVDHRNALIRHAEQVEIGSKMVSIVNKGQIISTVDSVTLNDNEEALHEITQGDKS